MATNKRTMSETLESFSETAAVEFYELVEINVGTKTYRVSNAPYNIEYGSNTFQAFGTLLSFDEIEENATMMIQKLTITVSGIASHEDSTVQPLQDFLGLDYTHAPVEITRVYYANDAYQGGFQVFRGYISSASALVNTSDETTVSIQVANHFSDFDRQSGRYTNSSSQQRYFPSDKGLDFSKQVQKEIKWE